MSQYETAAVTFSAERCSNFARPEPIKGPARRHKLRSTLFKCEGREYE
jgi:hypothetical protein